MASFRHEGRSPQEVSSDDTQDMATGSWDFYDFVDLDSPKAGISQHTTYANVQAPDHESELTQGFPNRRSSAYGQWLTVPAFWNEVPPNAGSSDTATTTTVNEMQQQIDELRQEVSFLVNEKRHGRMLPSSLHSKHVDGNDESVDFREYTRPTTPFDPSILDSFSFQPSSNEGRRPTDGYQTPLDQIAPFEVSDDSPIWSRRGSACSVGSVASKRGQRISGGYPCSRCDTRFDVPSQLKHHERKHMSKEERPHACGICGDRFLYPKDVTRHERQVHNTSRLTQTTRSGAGAASYEMDLEDPRMIQDDRRQRKRHQGQAVRGRRTEYIKQLESTVRTLSSSSRDPESRRDSGVADMEIGNVDKHVEIDRQDQQSPYSLALGDLHHQLATQRHNIQQLETSLHSAKEENSALSSERDAFAEIFSRTAIFPGILDSPDTYQHSTIQRAKGWIGAIETLLSSADLPPGIHESQVAEATNLLATALGSVKIQEEV